MSEGVKRKLTTILAADVEGYTRLMRGDEEATLETLAAYRDIIDGLIARHDGRVFGSGGDSVLAEFASAVESVRCAVSIQEEIAGRNAELPEDRRMAFRIGINVGDVMVRNGDLFGDGVNVAARLEGLAEAGGVCISGSVFEQIRHKLSLGVEDMGPQRVKNIAEPVTAYRLVPGPESPPAARPGGPGRWRMPAMAAAVAVIAAAGGLALWRPWEPGIEPASVERMAFPLPDKPSIAVLPFANLSDEPGQEYFADGMTDDLITDLSKISGLFVIARNSTFAYKGKAVDIRRVAEELGVRYVLEGSVRRAGDQIRINAQLIDATTGGHLWAERYDGSLSDVFALQDTVTRKIVAALAVNLTDAEAGRQAHQYTDNADAYDAFLQGWEYYQRFSAADFVKAVPFFEKAVQLDPNYGRAYAALASLYWESYRQGDSWTSIVEPDPANFVSFTKSRVKADKYLDLALRNPSPLAHRLASALAADYRQFDDAIAEAEQAVSLDPNDPDGHVALAWAMIFSGRHHEALAAVDRAMRLDPRRPSDYMYVLGMARIGLDRFEDAVAALQRAHERNPEYLDINAPLAAAYAHLGRDDEARVALKRYSDPFRSFATKVDGVMGWWPFKREADVRRFGGGLVKAGLCCAQLLEDYIGRVRLGGTLE